MERNVHPPADDEPGVDPIEWAAAEWLVRHDRGLSEKERREWIRWLARDDRHAAAFAKLETGWNLLDQVPAERFPPQEAPQPARFRSLLAGLAMAATFLVAALFLYRSAHDTPALPVSTVKRMPLPDGSTMALNVGSEVEITFSAHERRVRLKQGEASFEVQKDPARPFVVGIGEVDVRAVGTVFNVRLEAEAVEVLVTEGRVRVDDAVQGRSLLSPARDEHALASGSGLSSEAFAGKNEPLLRAGQRVTIALRPAAELVPAVIATVAPEELERVMAWNNPMLQFSAEPLSKVVAEFNRHNQHQLIISDARLGFQRFGGKLPTDDHEALVRLLEANFGVIAETQGDRTILRLNP